MLNNRHTQTPTWVPVTQDTLRNLQPGLIGGGMVVTFNGRDGTVVLTASDISTALGYVPASTSGGALADGSYGDITVSGTGTIMTFVGTINNGYWSGTDLSIANGGTGASSAAAARTNLDLYSTAQVDALIAAGSMVLQIDGGDASNAGAAYITMDGGGA